MVLKLNIILLSGRVHNVMFHKETIYGRKNIQENFSLFGNLTYKI